MADGVALLDGTRRSDGGCWVGEAEDRGSLGYDLQNMDGLLDSATLGPVFISAEPEDLGRPHLLRLRVRQSARITGGVPRIAMGFLVAILAPTSFSVFSVGSWVPLGGPESVLSVL